ncbi:hypothetical protein OE88DRAFT_1713963 [Heliocybe sulcata]|uniref:Uncharacterized protein n=1 Tax=Heliocybe sulcata TaxID=5364 RepID=A0A5C3MSK5_9AGAM|nr:hypothetical protein OE88DRAFT_1713963 [Heliocybe sulcata]
MPTTAITTVGRPVRANREDEIPLDELLTSQEADEDLSGRSSDETASYGPYPNASALMLGNWYWTSGEKKSKADLQWLSDDVLQSDLFNPADLKGVNRDKIDRSLAADRSDGWIRRSVTIRVPFGDKNISPKDFTIDGLQYRRLTSVLRSIFEDRSSSRFTYHPYRLLWQPPGLDDPIEAVQGELYISKAYLAADAELQASPKEPGCNLPRAIAAFMFWSDSTQLTDFSSASLWPVYALFGNQSKYAHGRPSAQACHHIAYLPKFIRDTTGKSGSSQLLTHCRRELMHAIWKILLDDEFQEAYRHGIIVDCSDGIRRRLYPRLFTYSADYPEKVLLATIRDKGGCPCPRCLIMKDKISRLGQVADMRCQYRDARVDDEERRQKVQTAIDLVYKRGFAVNSAAVERLLKPESYVPTENAFSIQLSDYGLNFFDMLVVDLLHEWELGVWKQILTHLIHLLHSEKGEQIAEFNTRLAHLDRKPLEDLGIVSGS